MMLAGLIPANTLVQAASGPRRVVVFVPGIATDLDGRAIPSLVMACNDPVSDSTFGYLKRELVRIGFDCPDFINYSYNGRGNWSVENRLFLPPPYAVEQSGQSIDESSRIL